MGTHPIFESDFDCLTECRKASRKLLVLEPTLTETTGHLTMMGRSITIIQMAAHLLKAVIINISLLQMEMTVITTTAELTATPVEHITVKPTNDMVNKSDTSKLSRSLL